MLETAAERPADLDRRVEAFEAAWAAGAPPDLARFIPPSSDPQFLPTVTELVRIDLEFRSERGEPARLDRYQAAFPELFTDRTRVKELAFEEYRLRIAAGDRPDLLEYAVRFGIDTTGWPAPPGDVLHSTIEAKSPSVAAASRVGFPKPGESILEFRIVSELGRGAFGRVYLAEQGGLAGRRVAVKLSTRFGPAEPETLARLQHTNIVPVYSTHRAGPFQIVVMPFLGSSTLADVLAELRRRGTWPATGRELADTLSARRSQTVSSSSDGQPTSDEARQEHGLKPDALSRFSFPNAVLWVGAQLAVALAHAHDRGVLHRDVKPANVLLTDDARPMLLDFNLADDASRAARAAGGTPAYMAPEQLRQLAGKPATVDGRTDVFGLGVVLFELLTGRHPFPDGDTADVLLRGRSSPPPMLRALNPAVTPSAEAIVRRCLEPDPARRYPSAAALAEDLERQLADRPLAHTKEPSIGERFRKWRRRHSRLASSGTVAAIAAVLVLTAAGVAYSRYERAKRLELQHVASGQFDQFRKGLPVAYHRLAFHDHAEEANALVARYGAADDPAWDTRPAVAGLPDSDRAVLRRELADLLLLLAWAETNRGERSAGSVETALRLMDRAVAVAQIRAAPRSVWLERAELLGRQGRADEAARARTAAETAPVGAQDHFLAGLDRRSRGKYRAACDEFQSAVREDPRHYWSWLLLGDTYSELGRHLEAEGCFSCCLAVEPDLPFGQYNRGLSKLRRKDMAGAERDFTEVLRIDPTWRDALVNRALARIETRKPAEAVADLDRALELGATETRLYFLRADARQLAGDQAGAAADRVTGLVRTPTDEVSYVARGLFRARIGLTCSALADFDAALALNPRSYPALQNKAYVLSEKLNRDPDSIVVLGQAIERYPDAVLARAGRAVLLARRGDRSAAHADARHCLARGPEPFVVYQLAGVFAQTSKSHPEDARMAFRLLADALRLGVGFDYVETDADLDPLRPLPEFKLIVETARALRPKKD
jgi:serine/threonine protein kinase/Tfp pilus assembly protein PilF